MAKKFYAVKRGVRPGVYETWSACEPLVKGFPGAIYKSFPTRQEAEAFVGGECVTEESKHTDENIGICVCGWFLQQCHTGVWVWWIFDGSWREVCSAGTWR
ncbi:MAG: viroplasmin family protein [Coprococcus sp.]